MITTFSVADMIHKSKVDPPRPIIDGLLYEGDICLIHGQEESFKSVFVFQIADNIAAGTELLHLFGVPKARRVGIVETELHDAMLGERLGRMYADRNVPDGLLIFGAMREFRTAHTMADRLKLVRDWVAEQHVEVLFLDIASDFFRGPNDSPSDEKSVASFFEYLRDMGLTAVVVRHDHKPRIEDTGDTNTNNLVRGSGEWKEDPEVMLWLSRKDRRTNEVELSVGKLRYGSKPDPMKPWFDAVSFRLTVLPPIVAVLENGPLKRRDILTESAKRFGLASRSTDTEIDLTRAFLRESQDGHDKVFELDFDRINAWDDERDVELWRKAVRQPNAALAR